MTFFEDYVLFTLAKISLNCDFGQSKSIFMDERLMEIHSRLKCLNLALSIRKVKGISDRRCRRGYNENDISVR